MNSFDFITREYKITVCQDGFISVRWGDKKPRLGHALPCYSADTIERALCLVGMVGKLTACERKDGISVEMRSPGWNSDAGLEQIEKLCERFIQADNYLRDIEEKTKNKGGNE